MFQYSEKLTELLFIELKQEVVKSIFKFNTNVNIDFPVRAKRLINDVSKNNYSDGFPISYLIEGMTFIMGADPSFKFNSLYKDILSNESENILIIKKTIAEEVKADLLEDAFILLNGLVVLESNAENYEKLIMIVHELAEKDNKFVDEEIIVLEKAKLVKHFPLVYFYESLLKQKKEDFEAALFSMNKFIENGGEITEEISARMEELSTSCDYNKGKELTTTQPQEALKLLLPLLDKFEQNPSIYFHIAVAYRNLKCFEKAIYYLNDAMRLDSDIIEVYNEFGLSYASMEDYKNAIPYFRKAFEVTKSIEICTNLVLCYYNDGDIEQSKLHLEIAKKINSDDEIVMQLEGILKSNEKSEKK